MHACVHACACVWCIASLFTVVWCQCHWLLVIGESCHFVAVYPVQEMEEAFLEAALVGDLPRVKDLISQGCPVSAQNKVRTLVHL